MSWFKIYGLGAPHIRPLWACTQISLVTRRPSGGSPVNALYSKPLAPGQYFEIDVLASESSAFVGVTTRESFAKGDAPVNSDVSREGTQTRTKNQPKEEVFGADIPPTSGGHSPGCPGPKLRSGRSKSWKKQAFQRGHP